MLACAALLAACVHPEAEPEEVPIQPETGEYLGVVTVEYSGTSFDNESITVLFQPAEDGKTASLEIKRIKFVPAMPVTIDVTIPDVELTSTSEEIDLVCGEVIPLAMGGEYPRYIVTGLIGRIVGDEMTFSLKFGDYPTTFRGVLQH